MRNLDAIADRLAERLEEKDQVREAAIKSARSVNRMSGTIVHSIHKGADVEGLMREAMEEARRLRSLLEGYPDIWESGLVEGSLQELAEAAILLALINGEDFPEPEEVGVTGPAYLLGMADAIGELRRFALEELRNARIDEAVAHLEMMEEMFLVIMRFDYPDALVPIRRKQDVARSLLERTRGDVAVAVSSRRLESRLEELNRKL